MIRNSFRILLYSVLFTAVALAAGFLVYRSVDFDKSGEVPELIGKSVTEASELLINRKLLINVKESEYSTEIKEGHIVGQDVKAGKRIPVGTAVNVTVSSGGEMYSMPSFEGQLLEDAKLTLNNLGIRIKKVTWVHSDTVEKGKIIAQRPIPGNISSNEINFLVSLGGYDVLYKCPSFVNMTIEDARVLAERLEIKLVEKERQNGNRIIFQKPEAESVIKKGDSVEVTLGRGWGMWF